MLGVVGAVFFLVMVVVALAGVGVSYWLKQKRRDELAAYAHEHGLVYSPIDTYGLDSLPFHLFKQGEGRGCENVLTGRWNDVPVTGADYWYYTESTDSEGHRNKTYHRFSVVVCELGAWLPSVQIGHENMLTRLADHLGFDDIDFESEEFNRRFRVKSKDREFAFKLLDAPMISWLLHTAGDHCYEVSGNHLLVYRSKVAPAELTPLFLAGAVFVQHIPRLVWADYGKEASS